MKAYPQGLPDQPKEAAMVESLGGSLGSHKVSPFFVPEQALMKSVFERSILLVSLISLALCSVALVDFVLHPLAQDAVFHSSPYRAVVILVLAPLTLLVGFLIMRRVPGNVTGPLLIVWCGTVAYWSIRQEIAPELFALFYYYDMIFGWLGLMLMLLHFPDGKILPPGAARWIYPLLGLNVISASLVFLSTATLAVPSPIANPFHLPALLQYEDVLLALALLLIYTPFLVMTLVSSVLHYRQGNLQERRQIKWMALFAGTLVVYVLLGLIAYPLLTGGQVMSAGNDDLLTMFFYLAAGLVPPLVIGVAVLRHQLWDIDFIVRRTLVYTLLTVILTLIYFGSVAGLQSLFTTVFGHQSPAAIVLSTLIIAASFTTLRKRIQERIDHRFYRHKYNAERVLAEFSATLREEVDIEQLIHSMLDVTSDMMQPSHVSLWLLKSDPPPKKR